MRQEACNLLRSARQEPILWSFQSDATSFKCRAQFQHFYKSTLQRRGRHLEEFLSQRCVIKTMPVLGTATPIMAMLVGLPRALRDGKSGDHHFVSACQFQAPFGLDEHESILIYHIIFDRAVFSSVHNRFMQMNAAMIDACCADVASKAFRENSRWLVGLGCCAHDMQNALKWGLARECESGLVNDLHIVIESLINSIAYLNARLKPWLLTVVSFTSEHTEEFARRWWLFLGVGPDYIDLFCEVRAWWRHGRLEVNPELCSDPYGNDKIMACWVYCMRWRHFSESRWCGIGVAARGLLRSLSIGLESLVSDTRAGKAVSDFYLGGFGRLSSAVKSYLATAAAATRPAEAFLLEVLEDDRLGRRTSEVHGALNGELRYLEDIASDVWVAVAFVVGKPLSHVVRHSALHAAHTSHAYITNKVFDELRQQPWNLVAMEPSEALDIIANMSDEDIEHKLVRQIKNLQQLGRPQKVLEDALLLMREVSWTTRAAEQSHASITRVHRHHPEASADTVALKAALHACRHLFQKTQAAKKDEALRKRVDKLKRCLPRPISARNVFISDYVTQAKRLRVGSLTPKLARQALAQAQSLYVDLPDQRKRKYDALGLEASRLHFRRVQADIEHAEAELSLFRTRLVHERQKSGVPNNMGECRFDDKAVQRLADRLSTADFGGKALAVVKNDFEACPLALSHAQKVALDDHQPTARARPPCPTWAAVVCSHRDAFRDCAFVSTRPEMSGRAWLFMYALQNPKLLMVLSLTPSERVLDVFHEAHLDASGANFVHEWTYAVDHTLLVSASIVPALPAGSDLQVVSAVSMLGLCKAASDAEAEPFLAFCERRALKADKHEAAPRLARASPPPSIFDEHPWLREVLRGGRGMNPAEGRPDDAAPSEHTADHHLEGPEDPDVDKDWDILREVDDLLRMPGLDDAEDFSCHVRASDGRERVRTEETRHVMVTPRAGEAKAWSTRFRMGPLYSFSIARYSEDGAWHLALETARRMQFFYTLACRSGDIAHFRYSPSDLASVPECREWMVWVAGLDIDSQHWVRACSVDTLVPVNPM